MLVAYKFYSKFDTTVEMPGTDDLEIEIAHSMCRGRCPVYTVEVQSTGNVIFTGEQYTTKIGRQEFKIEKDQLSSIASVLYDFGYFSVDKGIFCDDRLVLDASFTSVSVKWQGLERESEACLDHSSETLLSLVDRIENILNIDRWK